MLKKRVVCVLMIFTCGVHAQVTRSYRIDTFAGTLPDDEGTPAVAAVLDQPQAVAVGRDGVIYVSDGRSGTRRITPDGVITRVGGVGFATGIAFDRRGTLYFINGGPELYKKEANSETGTASRPTDNVISPRNFTGITVDSDDNVLLADQRVRRILRVGPTGAVSVAAGIGSGIELTGVPNRVAVDALNNIYVATDSRIFRISPNGAATAVAGSGEYGSPIPGGPATASPFRSLGALVLSGSGEVFVADRTSRSILKVDANGVLEIAAMDVAVNDMALDGSGNLLLVESSGKVWRLKADGSRTLIAGRDQFDGDGGPAADALLKSPRAVAVGSAESVFIGDTGNNRIRKVSVDGVITTVAGNGLAGFAGDGGPAAAAQVAGPDLLATGHDGNLYFSAGLKVRKLRIDGVVETTAGTGEFGSSGDGGPANAATFRSINGLAVDPAGRLFISDSESNRVRVITRDGKIDAYAGTSERTVGGDGTLAVASSLSGPSLLAADAEGNLVIYEQGAARLRRVAATTGVITTLSGTVPLGTPGNTLAGSLCIFLTPTGLAFDLDGSLLVAGSSVICRLGTDGVSWVVAGSGTYGFAGDGGAAGAALLRAPSGLTVDGTGNIFVADTGNYRIRKLTPRDSGVPASISATDAGVPSFLGKTGFSSNSYMEIYGANLSQTTRSWTAGDFNSGNAPTSLDGVSVMVNGKTAFVYYVSPTQININTPEDATTGPVSIQVKTPAGLSNVGMVNRSRLSPALHTAPQFAVGGKQYVIAQTPDFRSFVGNPNMIAGVPFAAAKKDDVVLIYAVGCGPTNPQTRAGLAATQNSAVAVPYEVKIGGVSARVNFAGMVANTIGLYQLNVVIPNVPAGDQPIELIIDGVSNAQNLMIVIEGS
jgi:uncharacterized protein (TIGR03437 family)